MPHDDLEIAADLLSKLDRSVAFLERVGEDKWAAWLRADMTRLKAGDAYGLEHLLSAFGGMGSLNDLVIAPGNGHPVTAEEAGALTAEWRVLASETYRAASSLR